MSQNQNQVQIEFVKLNSNLFEFKLESKVWVRVRKNDRTRTDRSLTQTFELSWSTLPATSVAVQQLFSLTGQIVTPR
jgi:hypothetical protein